MAYLLGLGLPGIIALIALVTFFIMALALHNISNATRNINRIMTAWSHETGIGMIFKCNVCKNNYNGRQPVCPHCGDKKTSNSPIANTIVDEKTREEETLEYYKKFQKK